MTAPGPDYPSAVHEHVHGFFEGHAATRCEFDRGPIQRVVPGFHAIEVAPGPRYELWVYVSVGCGTLAVDDAPRMEFLITSAAREPRLVERLAMTTHYHGTQTLGPGHTFPVGEPWAPGSSLDHVLVSLPYPFGPELEVLDVPPWHAHCYWLLPITAAERAFKKARGLEALEERFDETELAYWDLRRASVA